MSIKIASCEDSANIRSILFNFFKEMKQEEHLNIEVDFFVNAEQLLNTSKKPYDIYVLDIELGKNHLNGMKLAYEIREFDNQALIIFLTSKKEYIKEGYKVKAFRYLTKPTTYKEFKKEICDAVNVAALQKNRFIMLLESNQKYDKVLIDNIIYIETNGRKTIVHIKNREDIESSYSITQLTDILKDEDFYRCYSSYLVNLRYIDSFEGKMIKIAGKDLPVTRSKLKELKEILKEKMEDSI